METKKIIYRPEEMVLPEPRKSYEGFEVELVSGSCIDIARDLAKGPPHQLRVAIHNFANNNRPGLFKKRENGEICFSTNTQEEQLLRASIQGNEIYLHQEFYPICPPEDENEYALKTTGIKFNKDPFTGRWLNKRSERFEADMITCPALNLYSRNYSPETVEDVTLKRMILCLNLAKDHDVFITGLWGCGAFGHTIPETIRRWKQAFLHSTCMPKRVVFAVYVDILTNAADGANVTEMCQRILVVN